MLKNSNRIIAIGCLVYLLSFSLFAQVRKNVAAEYHIISNDSVNQLVVSYRIFLGGLVYTKNSAGYRAEYSVLLERYDSTDQILQREMFSQNDSVEGFPDKSSEKYKHGLCKLSYSNNTEKLVLKVTDENAQKVIGNYTFIVTNNLSGRIRNDVYIVEIANSSGTAKMGFPLVNSGGIMPFSEKKYWIIAAADSTTPDTSKIYFTSDSLSVSARADSVIHGTADLSEFANGVYLNFNSEHKSKYKYFLLKNISQLFFPVNYSISFNSNVQIPSYEKQRLNVIWVDRPVSSEKIEYAYKIMEHIDEGFTKSAYYKKSTDNPLVELLYVWKQLDATPSTAYNERMAEFFKRVDYALMNFSSLKGNDGAELDRGEMYIRLGAPKLIERKVHSSGKIAEIWEYEKLWNEQGVSKNFMFIDNSGTGNFELVGKR